VAFVLMVVALRSRADLMSVFVLVMLMLDVMSVVIVRMVVRGFRRVLFCSYAGLFRIMRMLGMRVVMVAMIVTFMAMIVMTMFVVMMCLGVLVIVITMYVVMRMIRRVIADLSGIRCRQRASL
jgi:hypothetical protein